MNTATKRVIIFDACSFWGYNEYDLAEWGPSQLKFSHYILEQYHMYIPRSSPKDEYDDIIRLYFLRFNLHDSAPFPSLPVYRKRIIEDMRYLVEKY